jgi:hypothetical protein
VSPATTPAAVPSSTTLLHIRTAIFSSVHYERAQILPLAALNPSNAVLHALRAVTDELIAGTVDAWLADRRKG